MNTLTTELIITYALFHVFSFYITKWAKDFRGASYKVHSFLSYYSFIATLFIYSMLVYFAFTAGFVNAAKLFGISLLLNILFSVIEGILSAKIVSIFKIWYLDEYIGFLSFLYFRYIVY